MGNEWNRVGAVAYMRGGCVDMAITFGDLFSGFGGVKIGAVAAGLKPLWSIEKDPDIAHVNALNFPDDKMVVMNILDADPSLFERVDLLHASPPCPNFSVAKANGEETELDIALARKTADFIEVLRPKYFTLENVYQYRHSRSWGIISQMLYTCGYWLDFEHVNAADYGVPQTRQRMIVRAVHNGFVPYLPKKESWRGWYEAIEDLIPDLPLSKFPPWQLEILHNHKLATQVFGNQCNGDERDYISHALADDPIMTLTTNSGKWTAFIMSGDNATNFGGGDGTIRKENEPMFTVRASAYKGLPRSWFDGGEVVKMTPRALARFQSFPDNYILPDKNSLACKGLGNAVPPLLMEKIYKGLLI
jgi:DNA (cytosine-5)-methyltransferase 1